MTENELIPEINLEIVVDGDLLTKIDYKKRYKVIVYSPQFDPKDKYQPFKFGQKEHISKIEFEQKVIREAVTHLENDGTFLVYSIPRWLPYYANTLEEKMIFKYWIALKNQKINSTQNQIQPHHEGLLLFVKKRDKFTINQVRYPHIFCTQCGDYLADWGGKKHLRPKYGPILSDVWDDRDDFTDENYLMSENTLSRIWNLTCTDGDNVLYITHKDDNFEERFYKNESLHHEIDIRNIEHNSEIEKQKSINSEFEFKIDDIVIGDCLDVMNKWRENESARFDLVFADPPYNLEKKYTEINDDLTNVEYIDWCNKWLFLSTLLLKPNGILLVLNLPKWSIHHALFLNNHLFFQRWIVWDALSDPRGKLMPAHYSLLMYSKDPSSFTINNLPKIPKMDQCFRAKCIKNRSSNSPKEEISDIWYDIHRIKHKRDRDDHPCQLPVKLLERVVQIFTNPGDVVLDPFMGTGTTAIAAKNLNRHYVGIDIDPLYQKIADDKLINNPPLL